MKALTIWQPWASLITHGPKRVENRTWRPPKVVIGRQVAIHSGKRFDTDFPERHQPALNALLWKLRISIDELPKGYILGTAIVVAVARGREHLPVDQHRWFAGPFGWILGEVRQLRASIPCVGAQGLWDLPADVAARVEDEARGVPAAQE